MSDRPLPALPPPDALAFDPLAPKPFVHRGLARLDELAANGRIETSEERGLTSIQEEFHASSANAIIAVSTRLATSVRRSLREAKLRGAEEIFLTRQDDEVYCLVYLAAHASRPVNDEAIRSMRAVIRLMVKSGRVGWVDTLGPRVALDLANGRLGPGLVELYANLNHHSSGFRKHVIRLAWLARNHLDPKLAAERILFNVGASHGLADQGVAVLRAMCADDQGFWSCIGAAWPDFANGEAYGWGLDSPWPERRDAVLTEALDHLRDPASELSQYVREPLDLWDVERKAAEKARSVAREIAVQPRLL